MGQLDKGKAAKLVREARITKGYTQQELSDLSGISLRSVQRIENGEVIPRAYTLRILAEKLGLPEPFASTTPDLTAEHPETLIRNPVTFPTTRPAAPHDKNRPRKLILTISIGLLFLLGSGAFLAQSAKFPETDFERFLFWMGVIAAYTLALMRIWKE